MILTDVNYFRILEVSDFNSYGGRDCIGYLVFYSSNYELKDAKFIALSSTRKTALPISKFEALKKAMKLVEEWSTEIEGGG